jgi:hypothetical protein
VLAPLTILPLAWKVSRTIHMGLREFAFALLPALSGAAAMILAVLALRQWMPILASWPVVIRLIFLIAAGAVVYGGVLMGLFRERVFRYLRFMRDLRKDKVPLEGSVSN